MYHWSIKQSLKYLLFLRKNQTLFELPLKYRKTQGIMVQISRYLKSKTSDQCRSHHQKMMVRYGSLDNLIRKGTKDAMKLLSKFDREQETNKIRCWIENQSSQVKQ